MNKTLVDVFARKPITTEIRVAHCVRCAAHVAHGGTPYGLGDCPERGRFHGFARPVWQDSTLGKTMLNFAGIIPWAKMRNRDDVRQFLNALPFKPFGAMVPRLMHANVITNVGHAMANGKLSAQGGYGTATELAIGINTSTANALDNALGQEIITLGGQRAAGTASQVTTSVTNDTMQLVHTWSFTGAFAIVEEGIFDATSVPPVTTLSASVTSGATSFSVVSGTGFVNADFIQIDNEIVSLTSGGGSTTLVVVRAQKGTSATTHASGAGLVDFTAGGGNMLAKQSFSVINVGNGDSLQVTHKVQS